jgi:outer membrane protein assembly factor BamB
MYAITGAPRIARGKVIIGNGGADFGVRGYVSAYDAETGKMAWRFYLVPGDPKNGPDHAASDPIMKTMVEPTWSGDYYKYGGGGTAWNAISYDPELQQIYVGTGNGSPWNYKIRSDAKGDNFFLCSIVALDVNTGKYKWHYQENRAESWDYNSVQPIMQADLTVDGRKREVLFHAPKNGFFYVIDRHSGKLVSANPFVGGITWAKKIDIASGRPVETPGSRFENGPFTLSPGLGGAHGVAPMAYSPKTGLVYFAVSENSMTMGPAPEFVRKEGGPSNTGVVSAGLGAKSFFIAFDPATGRTVWRHELSGGGADAHDLLGSAELEPLDVGDDLERRDGGQRDARHLGHDPLGQVDVGEHVGLALAPVTPFQMAVGFGAIAKVDLAGDLVVARLAQQFDLGIDARLEQAEEIGVKLAPGLFARGAGDEGSLGAEALDQAFLLDDVERLAHRLARNTALIGELGDRRNPIALRPHAGLDPASEELRELDVTRHAALAHVLCRHRRPILAGRHCRGLGGSAIHIGGGVGGLAHVYPVIASARRRSSCARMSGIRSRACSVSVS